MISYKQKRLNTLLIQKRIKNKNTYFFIPDEVFDEQVFLLFFLILFTHSDVETHNDGAQESSFEGVPEKFRRVAHYGLGKRY